MRWLVIAGIAVLIFLVTLYQAQNMGVAMGFFSADCCWRSARWRASQSC
ncbi:MAG: hypothetical protein R3C26_03440 [Calditrichia bacterium]